MSDGMAHLYSRLKKLAHGVQKVGHPCCTQMASTCMGKPNQCALNAVKFSFLLIAFSLLSAVARRSNFYLVQMGSISRRLAFLPVFQFFSGTAQQRCVE